ncbi:glycosyltransferase [Cellulosimicrobium sp. PMB13]|uniref:glycosyltransferase n=1 Tax=Cellulosimicrobium sp. PMB13 TaxID=3120158 RepID=UPI003F4C6EB6
MTDQAAHTSIVIGFRDWGLGRLELCLKALKGAFAGTGYEAIVSDFGSSDAASVQKVAENAGAKYVYTHSDVWARSRALNRGFEVARGDVIMATDADMLFSPGSLAQVATSVRRSPNSAVAIQCRDLPQQYSSETVAEAGFTWEDFETQSRLRPRWGMGGLFATTRRAFASVGGYDERMHTYGGEDLDFAQRCQRSGLRIVWRDDPSVRMYHMWHPPSRAAIETSTVVKEAVDANTQIVKNDPTVLRNTRARNAMVAAPLVSVVIATRDRGEYLRESINSVLAQSVQDFEVVVVNDGSSDDTLEVLDKIGDRRVRVFSQEPKGISAARNLGTDRARGRYIAVHDDDDIMMPTRLERSLNAIRPGVQATFGSWVNFDDVSGELALNVSKKEFEPSTVFNTGAAPGHSTWLLERELIHRVRYDEQLTSAVDHNLAVRLMNAGVKWAHVGRVLFLRRMHSRQVTVSDGDGQKLAAILTNNWYKAQGDSAHRQNQASSGKSAPWPRVPEKDDLEGSVVPYLPDHLAYRHVLVRGTLTEDSALRLSSSRRTEFQYEIRTEVGPVISGTLFRDVPWEDLPQLAASGVSYEVFGGRRIGPNRVSISDAEVRQRERSAILRECLAAIPSSVGSQHVTIAMHRRKFRGTQRFMLGSVSRAGEKPLVITGSLHDDRRDAELAAQEIADSGSALTWVVER